MRRGPFTRRRRRRPVAALALPAVVGALVVALVVGGLLRIGPASGPYDRSVAGTFAARVAVLADQSNSSGQDLASLMARLKAGRVDRAELEAGLDEAVGETAAGARDAEALTPPPLPVPSAASLADAAFGGRATAVVGMRRALDGLLGMTPLPVIGSALATVPTGTPATLSAGGATAALVATGAALESADRAYERLAAALGRGPGHHHLPASTWVRHPASWDQSSLAALVQGAAASPRLLADHHLQVVTVGLRPGAVPAAAPGAVAPGTSVVPPTASLAVTVVVGNPGNVDEPGVVVSVRLVPTAAGQGPGTARHWRIVLAPGGDRALVAAALAVRPGRNYALTVAVSPPDAALQADPSALRRSYAIEVAPATTSLPPSL